MNGDPFREAAVRDPLRDPRTDRERVESVKHFLMVELPARRVAREKMRRV